MSRKWTVKTAAAVVVATALGLAAFPMQAAAGEPAPRAGLWQQTWDFLFGGGSPILWGQDVSAIGHPDGGLTSLRGEEGGCMDPNGRPCAQSSPRLGDRRSPRATLQE